MKKEADRPIHPKAIECCNKLYVAIGGVLDEEPEEIERILGIVGSWDRLIAMSLGASEMNLPLKCAVCEEEMDKFLCENPDVLKEIKPECVN